jgi:hypothetical protein
VALGWLLLLLLLLLLLAVVVVVLDCWVGVRLVTVAISCGGARVEVAEELDGAAHVGARRVIPSRRGTA